MFRDEELKRLMCLPDDCTITRFTDKYFIEDESAGEIITDEAVRVIVHDSEGTKLYNSHMQKKFKEFDIYVKENVLHTATKDRLQNRYALIAERLKYLLLRQRVVEGLRFRYEDEYNLWTKTMGYKRYHIVFSYNTTW